VLDYPQVELAFMNRDHAEFVELREKLLVTLSRQGNHAEVDALLDRLLAHTRAHFTEEERLMQETRFPPYPMHKGEHDRVLANMESHIARWKQDRDAIALSDWLEVGLVDWFVGHVSTMDFVTARYIKNAQGKQ
jgi:hemerythrin